MITWEPRTVLRYLNGKMTALPRGSFQIAFHDAILIHELLVGERDGFCRVASYRSSPLLSIPVFHFGFNCQVIDEIPATTSDTCIGFYFSETRCPENLALSIYREDEHFFSFYPRCLAPKQPDDRKQT